MDKKFEVTSGYTRDAFYRMLSFTCFVRLKRIWFIFGAIALAAAVLGVMRLLSGFLPLGLLLLVFAVFFLSYPLMLRQRSMKAAMKQYDAAPTPGTITAAFYGDRLEITGGQGNLTYRYPEIFEAYARPGEFYLYLDRQRIAPLPMDRFTLGNPEDFPAFLRDKLGKRYHG